MVNAQHGTFYLARRDKDTLFLAWRTGTFGTYDNIGRARSQGVEVEAGVEVVATYKLFNMRLGLQPTRNPYLKPNVRKPR